ncbi:hypothetical protein [Acrocarpospora catenulata]|nr:hypothetical protein [Acrocarpospora catenulata]
MAREIIIHPGHPGTWPNGEPQSVRDAYDTMISPPPSSGSSSGNRA